MSRPAIVDEALAAIDLGEPLMVVADYITSMECQVVECQVGYETGSKALVALAEKERECEVLRGGLEEARRARAAEAALRARIEKARESISDACRASSARNLQPAWRGWIADLDRILSGEEP